MSNVARATTVALARCYLPAIGERDGKATRRWWLIGIGVAAMALAALMAVFPGDWLIPVVQSRVSAQIGRRVSIGHLHLQLGRVTTITAENVAVANPPGWPATPPLAEVPRLLIRVDLIDYLLHHRLNVPLIEIDHPSVTAAERPDGEANFRLAMKGAGPRPAPKIGDLRIIDGRVHAVVPKLRTNFEVAIDTREATGREPELIARARGTYGDQPIEARMVGGAILALRDKAKPWPIDLELANGRTTATLQGSIEEPLALNGARLRLRFAGPSMSALTKLTGIPIPETPPFELTGNLEFANRRVQFRNMAGRVGSSDVEGTVEMAPGDPRPVVEADLFSRSVDLADLGGFIGTNPGGPHTPGESVARREAVAHATAASPNLLPTTPLAVPRFHYADVHLLYHGGHIQGRSMPLDNLDVALDIVNGEVKLHPVSFGVGPGRIRMDAQLVPADAELRANADIAFQQVDVAKLMAATHTFRGAGSISGSGKIVAAGNSIATMAANGNGEFVLGMVGGDLSAILVDLSGLQFGNAVLSALGMPKRTNVECLVGDFVLMQGVLRTRALVVDTGEAIINGSGSVNLRDEKLDLKIRTAPKHFSIGSLPGPINISGTMKSPRILPSAETVARGAAAGALAVLLAPLALLPTIQFGTDDHHRCETLLAEAKRAAPGSPSARAPGARGSPMTWPVPLDLEPMEAMPVDRLPDGPEWAYEPKYDGFRCLAFRNGEAIVLQSRRQRPLGRFFPEMVSAIRSLAPDRFVLDGELVIEGAEFDTLQLRLHPAASRIAKLSRENPATFIAFDLLSGEDGRALLDAPFERRRSALNALFKRVGAARGVRLAKGSRSRTKPSDG